MQKTRSFGVTHGTVRNAQSEAGVQDTFAGVVTIAQEHLDMAPESLLSIAAKQSPDCEVVGLKFWPEPSVTALQVVLPSCWCCSSLVPGYSPELDVAREPALMGYMGTNT